MYKLCQKTENFIDRCFELYLGLYDFLWFLYIGFNKMAQIFDLNVRRGAKINPALNEIFCAKLPMKEA